ncbi:hypothetical protein DFH11DRAFT_1732311 [Phellopilus nigrolimitatus]|nr:hypothetical protein DFH11DRAFT_1732311 [Phellopilus nigrolimitatus]
MLSAARTFPLNRISHSSLQRIRHVSLNRPAPPPLPPKEQREFEELVRAAATPAAASSTITEESTRVLKGDELHPDARRTPTPEFEGDTNPITGEVDGPKREPVRHGDWSFGGRASDF